MQALDLDPNNHSASTPVRRRHRFRKQRGWASGHTLSRPDSLQQACKGIGSATRAGIGCSGYAEFYFPLPGLIQKRYAA